VLLVLRLGAVDLNDVEIRILLEQLTWLASFTTVVVAGVSMMFAIDSSGVD
jgi:hypothetical protein